MSVAVQHTAAVYELAVTMIREDRIPAEALAEFIAEFARSDDHEVTVVYTTKVFANVNVLTGEVDSVYCDDTACEFSHVMEHPSSGPVAQAAREIADDSAWPAWRF